MKLHLRNKLRTMSARHRRLHEEVDAMFAEFWPVRQVRHIIADQYGELISSSSLERYRLRLWQDRRELAAATAAALAQVGPSSIHRSADLPFRSAARKYPPVELGIPVGAAGLTNPR